MKNGLSERLKKITHLNECKKWAYLLADLLKDKNTNPAALRAAWLKFKRL